MIPATAIVVTRNETDNIAHCLLPLIGVFNGVLLLDSNSTDDTVDIARDLGAEAIAFSWNGAYPKKRQWCLDNIKGLDDWVFFIDADEIASPHLLRELRLLFARGAPACDGYFVRGRYQWLNRKLRFGLTNNKLCLFRRSKFHFPVVDDLDIPGMGEIEGHYQPVPTTADARIGALDGTVLHYNRKGRGDWQNKHERYAMWEAGMIARAAFPPDPVPWRQQLKDLTRTSPLRPLLVFAYSYFLKGGILDGYAGFDFALARAAYTRDVLTRLKKG